MSTRTAIATRNAALATLGALLNSGTLVIYSGSQPATPETSLSGTLLATLTFGSTAFGSAASGVITANSITSGTAVGTGTAGYFRTLKSDGTTCVYDGAVGYSGTFTAVAATDLITTAAPHGLSAGDTVRLSSTTTLPAGLAAATTYYVIASGLTTTALKLSATLGGSAIDITDTGTGTHTLSNFGTELNLASLSIVSGATIAVTSLTYTLPQ